MAKPVNPKYRELVKMFDSLTGSRGAWEVWNDTITMLAVSLSNSLDVCDKRREEREKLYGDISSKYTSKELAVMVQIFTKIALILEENPDQDLLGDLYMNLSFGSAALGQFFTPYSVCQMMAKCSVQKECVENQIEKDGYIIINEPACGGGANVIAVASRLKEIGINYQQSAFFVCQDLSQVTALMCYIQMSLLGMAGVVIIGDTLKNPNIPTQLGLESLSNVWMTPMYYLDSWSIRRTANLMDELLTTEM